MASLVAAGAAALATSPPAGASTRPVLGSAYGYAAKVSLFGSPPFTMAATPKVTLPKGGSASPVIGSAPSGQVAFGPAILFSSGPISVLTLGSNGSATSVASLESVGNSPFTANFVQSTCTSAAGAPLGVTTISNGVVVTSTDPMGAPLTKMAVPVAPPPDFTIAGTLQANGSTEHFKWVFNQQTTNANGSLTVNAAHEILQGPAVVGNIIIGHSSCRG
ncbi:MAG: hypothetical protein ACRDZ8_17920 [Acidimicrobiales bacterium]